MMYPIMFKNLYFYKIWGGRDFGAFRKNMPQGLVGESWDIACHPNGMSVAENGEFTGIRFDELIDKFGKILVGTKINTEVFPLLVKIINSKENLSVQVHPDDEYAGKHENQYGKTEAWYVINAESGATIIVGTQNCDKEIFKKAIEENQTEKYLNKINVKKGDFFLINSGLVHSICGGLVILEIQQNSDVTYRVYDYDRPREIHVEKALDVIRFELEAKNLHGEEIVKNEEYKKSLLCKNEYFGIEKYEIDGSAKEASDIERFFIFTVVEGEGKIVSKDFIQKITMGDSIFIPATLGEYEVKGNIKLLKSYAV